MTVAPGGIITAAVSLDPGNLDGQRGDWWMAAETPSGFYYYVRPGRTAGRRPAYQGALFPLGSCEVFSLDSSGLSPGSDTLHFGVDGAADGALTWGSLSYDSVVVLVGE